MDLGPDRRLVAELEQLVTAASVAYQACQLAAQQADLEGHALPAAVFRSISESYTGTAQGVLQVLATMEDSGLGLAGGTERNARAAMMRQEEIEGLSAGLAARVASLLGSHRGDDVQALLNLTANTRTRLTNMLAALPVTKKEGAPA